MAGILGGGTVDRCHKKEALLLFCLTKWKRRILMSSTLCCKCWTIGRVLDSKCNNINFMNSVIIFTSNIGSKDILDLNERDGTQEMMKERVIQAMRDN